MKKIIAVILSCMVIVGIFGACGTPANQGPAPESASGSAAPSTEPAAETEPTEAPVELVFLAHDGVKSPDGQFLRQIQVDAFNAANPDIQVTLQLHAEGGSLEYLKKLDLLSLSGGEYDICTLPSYANYAERAQQGTFAAITDLVKETYGKEYSEVFDYPAEVNGDIYGLPYNPSIYYVILNKDMLDAAGLPTPDLNWTWDDYRAYAKAMTIGDGPDKQYGSYMHTWTEYRREALFSTKMDNPYIKEDGSSNLDDPTFREWLQFVYDMEKVDGSQIGYGEAKATNLAYRDVFFNGRAAMVLTGSWIMDNIKDTEQFPHDFQTVFAPMPIWKGGQEGRATASCTYNAIKADSKNIEASLRFLEFMSGDANELVNQLSAQKGANHTKVLEAGVAGFENLYDMLSLSNVWNNPKLQPNLITQAPELMAEIEEVYNVETEMFMLDGQSLDTTFDKIIQQADAIIARHK